MPTPHLLVRGGTLFTPDAERRADLLVRDGVIADIGEDLRDDEAEVVDADGAYVSPGWVDLKAHLGEPGLEYRETIASGLAAAAAGGFTMVAIAPGTEPPQDTRDALAYVLERARGSVAELLPVGCLTKKRDGKELSEMADLAEAGAVAFSDGGHFVRDAGLMRRALEYARMLGKPVFVHPEQPDLACGGQMHEGAAGTRAGVRGIPSVAEEVALARDLLLAAYTGTRLHVQHATTAGSLDLLRAARMRGQAVTAAVTPWHAFRTDADVEATGYDVTTKLRPPLRPASDVQAVQTALADGTLDAVFSDHTPYAVFETEVEFGSAPFGVTALETLWSSVVEHLILPGHLPVARAVALLADGPRRVLGRPACRLEIGAPASLTVFDTTTRWRYGKPVSKSRHSPYLGRELVGRVRAVYHRGRLGSAP